MSKGKMLRDPQKACGARPWWIPGHVTEPPARMLCTRRRKHGGRHKSGQDHNWDRTGRDGRG